MESSKKKVVTKVIIKNILAGVCTLCMVFCLMPSNARADGDDIDVTPEEGAATTGTVNVTLNLDGDTWAEQQVVALVKADNSSTACTYAGGVYSAEVLLNEEVWVYVNNVNTGKSFNLTEEQTEQATEID